MGSITDSRPHRLRHISLSYNNADSERSALRLVCALFPEWGTEAGEIKFTRFTDGITNTLLKASKLRPGWTPEQIDEEAVLLRAYGKGTEVLIDREKETTNHLLLAERDLAPPLLAQFTNGLLYRFIPGNVCSAYDLQQERVWRAVARRLAEWHARLPVEPAADAERVDENEEVELVLPQCRSRHTWKEINSIAPGKLAPNPWTVMQKWIFALPNDTPDAVEPSKTSLQAELRRVVDELADLPGIGTDGLVLSHCDLLCGNVIVEPRRPSDGTTTTATSGDASAIETVSFIDYEYATPAPAAFDLANHFAEWGGLDCDYTAMPTRSVRREFLKEYLSSYRTHLSSSTNDSNKPTNDTAAPSDSNPSSSSTAPKPVPVSDADVDALFETVDRFRGLPGLYWGIWARIQDMISQIDFDYARYARDRFSEYENFRATEREGTPVGVREKRWAEE